MAAELFDAAWYTTSCSRFARAAAMCGVTGSPGAALLYFGTERTTNGAPAMRAVRSACLPVGRATEPGDYNWRLGHVIASITLDTYSHVLPGLQREAAAGLDALLQRKKA